MNIVIEFMIAIFLGTLVSGSILCGIQELIRRRLKRSKRFMEWLDRMVEIEKKYKGILNDAAFSAVEAWRSV